MMLATRSLTARATQIFEMRMGMVKLATRPLMTLVLQIFVMRMET